MPTHPFDKLKLNNGASFIFTPCPGTKNVALATSVQQLKKAGADAIITLMYDDEMITLGAESLSDICKTLAIKWFQLPILDDAAPNENFEVAFKNHRDDILKIFNNQGTIAVHCKGGSGRTGLVIGLLMAQLGYKKLNIITEIQKVRPNSLKNSAQLAYFNNFGA